MPSQCQKNSKTGVRGLSISTSSSLTKQYKADITCNGKSERKYFPLTQKQEAIEWLEQTRARLYKSYTKYRHKSGFKTLALRAELIIDPQYEHLRDYCHFAGRGYATFWDSEAKRKVYLHRYIYEKENGCTIPSGMQIDHCDCNKINNTTKNLILVNGSQNQHNKLISKNSKTGIKGLTINTSPKGTQVYYAGITVNNELTREIFALDQKAEAITRLKETRARLHGKFANNG